MVRQFFCLFIFTVLSFIHNLGLYEITIFSVSENHKMLNLYGSTTYNNLCLSIKLEKPLRVLSALLTLLCQESGPDDHQSIHGTLRIMAFSLYSDPNYPLWICRVSRKAFEAFRPLKLKTLMKKYRIVLDFHL